MQPNSLSLIIGNRCCGKGTLPLDLMKAQANEGIGIVVTNRKERAQPFEQFGLTIKSEEEFESLIRNQYLEVETLIQNRGLKAETAFFVADQCFYDKKQRGALCNFFNHRLQRTTSIIVQQYPIDLPDLLVDYVFAFNSNTHREKLYTYFKRSFPSLDAFNQVLNQMEPFTCLVCDLKANKIFFYKANFVIPH